MITYNLKNIIDFAQHNSDIYDVYYQKDLEFLGVIIFIYHKTNSKVIFEDSSLNFLHVYLNGLVIQCLPSNKYKLLICPDDPSEDYVFAYRYENGIISNYKDTSLNKKMLEKIKDIKDGTYFKFFIDTKNNNLALSLVNYY